MIAGRGCGRILKIEPCCSFDDLDIALSECLLDPKCIGVWKEVENSDRIAYLLCRTINLQYKRPANHKLFLKGKMIYFTLYSLTNFTEKLKLKIMIFTFIQQHLRQVLH